MPEGAPSQGGRNVSTVRLSPRLFEFFTQRRYADRLSIQSVLSACVVAYVLGDIEVTQEGYRVPAARPSEEPVAVIERDDGSEDVLTLEDLGVRRELIEEWKVSNKVLRPDKQVRKGTRWLKDHLEDRLQRTISITGLRKFLSTHFPNEREHNRQEWRFTGADDPFVARIETRMRRYPLWTLSDQDRRVLGLDSEGATTRKTDEQLFSDRRLLEEHVAPD